jgi:predicted aspartyl protease
MGRFNMKLELANNSDINLAENGHLTSSEVRRYEVDGVVDTGSAHLVIPGTAMRVLGLDEAFQARVRYADGHSEFRSIVKNVWLRLCDRDSVFSAVVEPNRDTALIGAIVLEELDLVVDCVTQSLHPRDPDRILTEIE